MPKKKNYQELKEQFVILLSQGLTLTEIQRQLKVDYSTLCRWRQDREVQKRLNNLQIALLQESTMQNGKYAGNCYKILYMIASDTKTDEKLRIQASSDLVKLTNENIRLMQSLDQEKELIELREKLDLLTNNIPPQNQR